MAVTDRLRALAARAPVPVLVAAASGAEAIVATLRASSQVTLVTTPRHATILLVAGRHGPSLHAPLHHVHDQVPRARATAVVGAEPAEVGVPAAHRVPADYLVLSLRDLHARLMRDDALTDPSADPDLAPGVNPIAWRGVGPHGQGGRGMMGGTPYGRSMAMTADGRDGLALDRLGLRLGPFLPGLPPLVTLDVGLQGDVLETAEVGLADAPVAPPALHGGRLRLHALAELLALVGLGALARRAARLAVADEVTAAAVTSLRERLDRPWGLRPATDGVGRLEDGDASARWRRWLDVAADDREAPAPDPVALDRLGNALVGMEIGAALLTLASLRPELAATAAARIGAP